jgi:hypothetical protein
MTVLANRPEVNRVILINRIIDPMVVDLARRSTTHAAAIAIPSEDKLPYSFR